MRQGPGFAGAYLWQRYSLLLVKLQGGLPDGSAILRLGY